MGLAFVGDEHSVPIPPCVASMHMGISFANREMKHMLHDCAIWLGGYNNLLVVLNRVGLDKLHVLKKFVATHSKDGTVPNLNNEIPLSQSWGQFRGESKDYINLFNEIEKEIQNQKGISENERQKRTTTMVLYRINLIESLQLLDYLTQLDHETTSDEDMESWIETDRQAFMRLSELRGRAVKI